MRARLLSVLLFIAFVAPAAAQVDYQPPPDLEPIHRPYDKLLDDYVRDGMVYYHALQLDRGKLDRYLVALSDPSLASQLSSWDKPRQIAFWINAYNALSLQTAINHYPRSMRQIPGAFDQLEHVVAGKTLTLDQIENTILAGYNDPRIFLALGRSAFSSGRLRSEAFRGPHLAAQLAESTEQFAKDPKYVHVDELAGVLSVSPILSWRENAFVDAYKDKSMELPGRTPIELAVVGLIQPYLLPIEREYLEKNTWRLAYLDFDWKLNDRAGIRH